MARAMTEALRARDVPDAAAQVAAELKVPASRTGCGRWAGTAQDEATGELPALIVAALRELHAAATRLA